MISSVDISIGSFHACFKKVVFLVAELLILTVVEIVNFSAQAVINDGFDLFPVFNLFTHRARTFFTVFIHFYCSRAVATLILTPFIKKHHQSEIWVFIGIIFMNAIWVET